MEPGGLLSGAVIAAAIEVHRHLGPGLLESAYEECLRLELAERGIQFRRQVLLPIRYKGYEIPGAFRVDLVISDSLVVELKTVEKLLPVHRAQVLTYLHLSGLHLGLLLNFQVEALREGIERLVVSGN